ncbi:hypothetical protein [Actinacidiphila acididurans]|uniref:Uncharacterized protein n=1 Tax=Actinacidiphila acididurans TaxID=2784346 RepID=A0ABS2TTY5_9ACTN|nr:hypothetical protein [Actinacidiphila acididurans]MBM9506804.1 hypothetical protein [Actinacidiphila acididurans]
MVGSEDPQMVLEQFSVRGSSARGIARFPAPVPQLTAGVEDGGMVALGIPPLPTEQGEE